MGSWLFDGVDDYLQTADTPALRTLTTAGTWWAWYKRTGTADTNTNSAILHKNKTTGFVSYALGRSGTAGTAMKADIRVGNLYIIGNYPVPADTWEFHVGIYDGETGRFRVYDGNGTLMIDGSNTGPSGSIEYDSGPLRIGRNEGSSFLRGKIACAGAHGAVLTDEQITTIRTTGVPPVTPSAFYLPMTSATIEDTAQGHTFTVTGATYDAADGPPIEDPIPAAPVVTTAEVLTEPLRSRLAFTQDAGALVEIRKRTL